MNDKPVEVWCMADQEGELLQVNLHELRALNKNYRCERRLLVRPGETWQDGVEAAADKFRELMQTYDSTEFDSDLVEDELRALSPATPEPSVADKLLRDQYNELIMAVAKKHSGETRHQTALRYIQQAERPSSNAACATKETYLKERG